VRFAPTERLPGRRHSELSHGGPERRHLSPHPIIRSPLSSPRLRVSVVKLAFFLFCLLAQIPCTLPFLAKPANARKAAALKWMHPGWSPPVPSTNIPAGPLRGGWPEASGGFELLLS
jgi:hypothetical protein